MEKVKEDLAVYHNTVATVTEKHNTKSQNDAENDSEIAAYKAMAADTEREQEALEWCNAYFGPARQ